MDIVNKIDTAFNLKALVHKSMDDLIVEYSLVLIEVSESEVCLKSETYVLDIFADREGVYIVYFDTTQKPPKGYNVCLFLVNKRRDSLVFLPSEPQVHSYTEFVENGLIRLVQHVRSAGKDILDGDKEWLKSYSWSVVHPSDSIVILL